MQRTGLGSRFCQLIAGFSTADSSLPSCLGFVLCAVGLKFHFTGELQGLDKRIMQNAGSCPAPGDLTTSSSIFNIVKAVGVHV